VKTTDRYKTTEQVERAFVEDRDFSFLYQDGEGFHFMNDESFEQLQVSEDILGDQAQWLQEGMKVILSLFNGVPVAIQQSPGVVCTNLVQYSVFGVKSA
jgi:elongation factor P